MPVIQFQFLGHNDSFPKKDRHNRTYIDQYLPKTTARAPWCQLILCVIFSGIVFELIGFLLGIDVIKNIGRACAVIFVFVATFYSYWTGVIGDWWHGAPISGQCWYLALLALVGYIYIALLLLACTCTVLGAGLFVGLKLDSAQSHAQHKKKAAYEYLESDGFKSKCLDAFVEADKDKRGKLSLPQLKEVELFDLTSEQIKKVHSTGLCEQAFYEFDADRDEFLNAFEFLQAMKRIYSEVFSP